MPNDSPSLFPEYPRAFYRRLCPAGQPHAWAELSRLAQLMKRPGPPDTGNPEDVARVTMPSGYVYFGQFVDHDLTLDTTSIAETGPHPEATPNFRTPRLDLEVLYGDGPSLTPELYDNDRLRIGQTSRAGFWPASASDLYRLPNGRPVVLDHRSEENLIVAQMHVLWSKLHNALLGLAQEDEAILAGVPDGSLFERVRRLTTWLYQWIVLYDFLPSFVQSDIWRDIFVRRQLLLYPSAIRPSRTPLALPIEFTAAAFRFGHSMVRNEYSLSRGRVVETAEILRMTYQGRGLTSELPADYVVDWDIFLDEKTFVNRGKPIDAFLARELFNLPGINLPEVTLRRGSLLHLPSGEEFARAFRLPVLDLAALAGGDAEAEALLGNAEFRGRTPLWYYLLREAASAALFEVGHRSSKFLLQKLGQAGSRIVTEVFFQVLSADEDSILNAGQHWRPPSTTMPGSSTPETLDSLLTLSRLAESC